MLLDVNLSKQEQMLFIEQNVIGNSAEFATPFGQRHLTYADYTASGRSLQVEPHRLAFALSRGLTFHGFADTRS